MKLLNHPHIIKLYQVSWLSLAVPWACPSLLTGHTLSLWSLEVARVSDAVWDPGST